MSTRGNYIPKRFPAYTIDEQGRIREYWGADAWSILRDPGEQRIFKKDLPKNFEVFKELDDYDV